MRPDHAGREACSAEYRTDDEDVGRPHHLSRSASGIAGGPRDGGLPSIGHHRRIGRMQRQRFTEGMPVYDAAGERLGALHEYYVPGGYLVVQKGFLFHKDLYIPVNAVGRSDADGIYLQLYKDDLEDGHYDNPPTGGATGAEDYVQTTT